MPCMICKVRAYPILHVDGRIYKTDYISDITDIFDITYITCITYITDIVHYLHPPQEQEETNVKIVTIASQKGGVSKTTTAYSLGTGLHSRGYKVLFVDLDAQSNLSYTAQVDLLSDEFTLYDVFKGTCDVRQALHEIKDGMSILTGGINLVSADMEFSTVTGREFMLREILHVLDNEYDYCIIDTPPTLGIMTTNALVTSHELIVPIKADIYALQGIGLLQGAINNVRSKSFLNPNLMIKGFLITCIGKNSLTRAMVQAFENTAADFGTKLFDTKIRQTVSVGESAVAQQSIFEYAPKCTASIDYNAFVDEYLN